MKRDIKRRIADWLFVLFVMVLLFVTLRTLRDPKYAPAWTRSLGGFGLGMIFLVLSFFLCFLYERKIAKLFARKSVAEQIREFERLDLLESAEFHAKRAFGVREFEDEGSHYFLELVDGRVLFLSGQYLYDYEPITDDPKMNQPRTFPCSEFTVRRHKKEGYVVDMHCDGTVLEPEAMAPPFGLEDFRAGVYQDGQVITDVNYDDLKRKQLGAA